MVKGFDAKAYEAALAPAGYPKAADPAAINKPVVIGLLTLLLAYVAMVYGPIAAFLVELFPTRIRYSSMSLPYHIGNGWFGGFLPLIAASIVVFTGDIYAGLWFPILVAAMSFIMAASSCRRRRTGTCGRRLDHLTHYTARYCVWGDGPPLVLVPGLAGGFELLGPLARLLARDFQVISYQLRGEDDCFSLHRASISPI